MSEMALEYIAIRSWALPGALLLLAGTGAARGLNDPHTPLLGATAQYGTNLVLDLALVFGLDMGVAGAAAAATIGKVCWRWGLLVNNVLGQYYATAAVNR
jgi:Na+-driven multidrug efflux pump